MHYEMLKCVVLRAPVMVLTIEVFRIFFSDLKKKQKISINRGLPRLVETRKYCKDSLRTNPYLEILKIESLSLIWSRSTNF